MEINFEIKLSPKQQEAYDLLHNPETKELVLLFSRQSGKSTLAELLMTEYALVKGNERIIYISPVKTQGGDRFRNIKAALEPTGLIKKSNANDKVIELTNGSIIQFLSTEGYVSIRGKTASSLLILDECSYIPETTPTGEFMWSNVIAPIAKTLKPKIVYISTPAGKQGFFYEKHLRAISDEYPYIKEVKATIEDDIFSTQEEKDRWKSDSPPLAWAQEYECKFLDSSLTALPGFEDCFKKNVTVKNTDTVWAGIDWSSTGEDRTVVTVINIENNVKQYIINDRSYDIKYEKIANILDSYPKLQACYVEVNGIGSPMYDGLKKKVKCKAKLHEFVTTNSSKADAVETLQLFIDKKEIHFSEEDTILYQEMGTFTYTLSKTKKVTYAAKPPHHDDTVLSLCFAVKAKEDYKSFDVKKDVVFIRQKNMTIR